jgi:hypothetical protein
LLVAKYLALQLLDTATALVSHAAEWQHQTVQLPVLLALASTA